MSDSIPLTVCVAGGLDELVASFQVLTALRAPPATDLWPESLAALYNSTVSVVTGVPKIDRTTWTQLQSLLLRLERIRRDVQQLHAPDSTNPPALALKMLEKYNKAGGKLQTIMECQMQTKTGTDYTGPLPTSGSTRYFCNGATMLQSQRIGIQEIACGVSDADKFTCRHCHLTVRSYTALRVNPDKNTVRAERTLLAQSHLIASASLLDRRAFYRCLFCAQQCLLVDFAEAGEYEQHLAQWHRGSRAGEEATTQRVMEEVDILRNSTQVSDLDMAPPSPIAELIPVQTTDRQQKAETPEPERDTDSLSIVSSRSITPNIPNTTTTANPSTVNMNTLPPNTHLNNELDRKRFSLPTDLDQPSYFDHEPSPPLLPSPPPSILNTRPNPPSKLSISVQMDSPPASISELESVTGQSRGNSPATTRHPEFPPTNNALAMNPSTNNPLAMNPNTNTSANPSLGNGQPPPRQYNRYYQSQGTRAPQRKHSGESTASARHSISGTSAYTTPTTVNNPNPAPWQIQAQSQSQNQGQGQGQAQGQGQGQGQSLGTGAGRSRRESLVPTYTPEPEPRLSYNAAPTPGKWGQWGDMYRG